MKTRNIRKIAKRRFHVRKLEERIVPKAHFNPQSRLVGWGNTDGCLTTYCVY